MMSITAVKKDSKPIFLTTVLLLTAIAFLYLPVLSNEISLWVDVTFFAILNVGFLTAAILGMKTRNRPIVLFSVLANSVFMAIGMLFILLYLFIILFA